MSNHKNYVSMAIGVCFFIALSVYVLAAKVNGGVIGVLLGIGISFLLTGLLNIIINKIQSRKPETIRQNYIEYKDERNVMIRYRAKAKAGDISQWFIMGIAYLLILTDAPLWIILVCVGAFLMNFILYLIFMSKYSKEM